MLEIVVAWMKALKLSALSICLTGCLQPDASALDPQGIAWILSSADIYCRNTEEIFDCRSTDPNFPILGIAKYKENGDALYDRYIAVLCGSFCWGSLQEITPQLMCDAVSSQWSKPIPTPSGKLRT